jgi:hypothetical protein
VVSCGLLWCRLFARGGFSAVLGFAVEERACRSRIWPKHCRIPAQLFPHKHTALVHLIDTEAASIRNLHAAHTQMIFPHPPAATSVCSPTVWDRGPDALEPIFA